MRGVIFYWKKECLTLQCRASLVSELRAFKTEQRQQLLSWDPASQTWTGRQASAGEDDHVYEPTMAARICRSRQPIITRRRVGVGRRRCAQLASSELHTASTWSFATFGFGGEFHGHEQDGALRFRRWGRRRWPNHPPETCPCDTEMVPSERLVLYSDIVRLTSTFLLCDPTMNLPSIFVFSTSSNQSFLLTNIGSWLLRILNFSTFDLIICKLDNEGSSWLKRTKVKVNYRPHLTLISYHSLSALIPAG